MSDPQRRRCTDPERTVFAALQFDLDGTLLDTVPDLAAAANRMLEALGQPPLSVEMIATFVGRGIGSLVERSLLGRSEGS